MSLPARCGRVIDASAPPSLRHAYPALTPVLVPEFPAGHPPDAEGLYLSLDETARHLEERLYAPGGVLQARTVFTSDALMYERYDTTGQLHDPPDGVAVEIYFPDGGLAESRSLQHGRPAKTTMYNETGEELESHEYAADGTVRRHINEPALTAYMQRGALGGSLGPDLIPLTRVGRATPGWMDDSLLALRTAQYPEDAADPSLDHPAPFAAAAQTVIADAMQPPPTHPHLPARHRQPSRPTV